jgi:hypothetical protein
MASYIKIQSIATLVVGLQLFDITGTVGLFSIIFNTTLINQVPVEIVLATEPKALMSNYNLSVHSNFVPPPKGVPIRTQGSGTR